MLLYHLILIKGMIYTFLRLNLNRSHLYVCICLFVCSHCHCWQWEEHYNAHRSDSQKSRKVLQWWPWTERRCLKTEWRLWEPDECEMRMTDLCVEARGEAYVNQWSSFGSKSKNEHINFTENRKQRFVIGKAGDRRENCKIQAYTLWDKVCHTSSCEEVTSTKLSFVFELFGFKSCRFLHTCFVQRFETTDH